MKTCAKLNILKHPNIYFLHAIKRSYETDKQSDRSTPKLQQNLSSYFDDNHLEQFNLHFFNLFSICLFDTDKFFGIHEHSLATIQW